MKQFSKTYISYAETHHYCEADLTIDKVTQAVLPHHILSRGAHGCIDNHWNLISLSFANHVLIHQVGQKEFLKRFPLLQYKFDFAKRCYEDIIESRNRMN